ncbi:2-(1,2-epoxy-1,2-dihydrophenyl)acetyl-CoA isomerase [Chitinophaga terrae (ex Kim and Jung 2007)]|jgi:2-(1,2-epoxy-1,2-dihydrophenyl)acetyl-CoA isomerase|uniref:2-(1,2-epoxy-1,2-dihydrophenyl)acetyl-CoA isomerase n=1 Tax=Chitinophaga terrae (ex Kim and Jung 2007) TaxID=408074 RepID=A0A1H4G775_9BACT|nr:enoyl-CoA hydratase-related protein [Chitinophaga terrae (ex Kim and Jung 2007)]GEP92991.1 2-(1,2-epoxy-1,2-dihydrophenyl)acetyl-CoA isomerase [Chitinophaga terrae (ex Kim and Jung 2007)]SEB04532.1 2-(1,2-epoxy-1,2-dihydrophenyl)acetyl-CoA isomerase [Chitinophaga terrae (ex Kim and Jung 2007)]
MTLLLEIRDGIATITLNRPEVYNAFNDPQSYELQDALKKVEKDETVRVVVLTGAGKAFSSGQDLKAAMEGGKRDLGESLRLRYNPIIRAIRQMPKPVICRLNGVAAGAGCSIALACDVIIASEEASMIEIFINIALVLDSGSSYFLPRTVGYHRAFELATKATKISAAEALQLGLVNKVVPAADLDTAVAEEAAYYAAAPTKAIGLLKKLLNKGMTEDLDKVLDYEAYCQQIAGSSADNEEGIRAFLEKRKPVFKGK